MKKTIFYTTSLAGILTLTAFTILNINWNIDPNYSIKFSGTKAEGTFKGLSGTISFDPNNLTNATINVSVDASTISTGNTTKDKHAKGDSWFDVTKYPTINFTSQSFTKSGNDYIVVGSLTLHGTSKEVSIPFQFTQTSKSGLFTGLFKINRKDFGINGNMMGFMVGKEFTVELKVPVNTK